MTTLLDHLKTRFLYDAWANARVAGALVEASAAVDVSGPVEQVSHLLRAADVWNARLDGAEPRMELLWEPFGVDALPEACRRVAGMWEQILAGFGAAALEEPVVYRNSKGRAFRHAPSTILAHVANHGTHHRAQAVRMLRDAGVVPPVTDWIAWVREGKG